MREDASAAGRGAATEADAEAKKTLGKRVAKAEKEAESRAHAARNAVVKNLQPHLDNAREQCRERLQAVEELVKRVPGEKEALLKKRTSEAEVEATELRQRRKEKYAQTVGLQKFALETQIEKERLEGTLYSGDPKLSVITRVQVNVKELAEKLQVLEVDGVNNRKSQGILMHTLRALEGRAAKAETAHEGQRREKKDDNGKDDYVPSEAIRKKQERQAEQEVQFHEALETEIANLRTDLRAKAEAEVAALGVARRDEAESHRESIEEAGRALAEARQRADGYRQWLGCVVPLARASARASEVAAYLREGPAEGRELEAGLLRARLKTAVVRLEDVRDFLSAAQPAESPRETGLDQVAGRIGQALASIDACRAENPDPQKPKKRKKRESKTVSAVATDESQGHQASLPPPPPPALEPEAGPAAPPGAGTAALGKRPVSAAAVRPPMSRPPATPQTQVEPPAEGATRQITQRSKITQGLADLGGELAALESALGEGARKAAHAAPPRPGSAAAVRSVPSRKAANPGDGARKALPKGALPTRGDNEVAPRPATTSTRGAAAPRGGTSSNGAGGATSPKGAAAPWGPSSPKGAASSPKGAAGSRQASNRNGVKTTAAWGT